MKEIFCPEVAAYYTLNYIFLAGVNIQRREEDLGKCRKAQRLKASRWDQTHNAPLSRRTIQFTINYRPTTKTLTVIDGSFLLSVNGA